MCAASFSTPMSARYLHAPRAVRLLSSLPHWFYAHRSASAVIATTRLVATVHGSSASLSAQPPRFIYDTHFPIEQSTKTYKPPFVIRISPLKSNRYHPMRRLRGKSVDTFSALDRSSPSLSVVNCITCLEYHYRKNPRKLSFYGSSGITRGFFIGWFEGTGKKAKEFIGSNPGWAKPGQGGAI